MNIPVWLQVAPLIISLLTLVGSAVAWYATRGQRRADEASTLTSAAMELVNELQERVRAIEADLATEREARIRVEKALQAERAARKRLEGRVVVLEKENDRLQQENCELKAENEHLRERGK